MGNNIIIAGLIVQVIVFGLFVIAAAIFHARLRSLPTASCHGTPWEKHMVSLYLVSILIFVRSIVRVVHEYFLYIFDALVMWAAMVVMNWIHPSEVAAYLRGGKAFTKGWKLQEVGTMRMGGYSTA